VTKDEWQQSTDPDPMVRALPADQYQRELRLFAIGCVRRVWDLVSPGCRAAVEMSERFSEGRADKTELAAVMAVAEREVQAAVPGHTAPTAHAYAVSAAVDASSVWPRTAANVLAAASCAASAAGCAAAEADEARYDEVFEKARVAELAAQASVLRTLVRHPDLGKTA
jgi:hypothetical protein